MRCREVSHGSQNSYRIPQIFRVGKYWRMASSLSFAFKIFADAASCEKGEWEQQLPSRIKISRMICEPRKPRNFSYSKYLRYTVWKDHHSHQCIAVHTDAPSDRFIHVTGSILLVLMSFAPVYQASHLGARTITSPTN